MRIVGGALKGRNIIAPSGVAVRPTTDRVREAIFNMLAHGSALPRGIDNARVLDLFAGTGALGLEALSRGAAYALFVDNAVQARGALRGNIEALALTGRTRVFRRNAIKLGDLPANAGLPFNIIFLDPPYEKGLGPKALAAARTGGWLAAKATIIFELSAREDDPEAQRFELIDVRTYGDSKVAYLRGP
ncbi:MAG TPA: 16S rRNA (guanine(966)-N(2))-methyltransferase RsmD [Gammaproteobacteria bacterium]|nr:16S rRNA (guanine(966)-N(2))-methyltransferase RsmD [Gammaproteobacteria bacterium]